MSSAQTSTKAASSSKGAGLGDDKTVQLTTFAPFPRLPQEMKDMIWNEAVKEGDQQGINFVQFYSVTNRQGKEMSEGVRLDKYSKANYLARIKITCKDLKKAIVRHLADEARDSHPVAINTHFGVTQVQLSANDIVFLGSLHDPLKPYTTKDFPTQRGGTPKPRDDFFRLDTEDPVPPIPVPTSWMWIRRFGVASPLSAKDGAGLRRDPAVDPSFYNCFAFNLSGLRNLEEVFLAVEGCPKPTEDNSLSLLTQISPVLFDGPGKDWEDLRTRCFDFDSDNEDEDDVEEVEFDPESSLEAFKGRNHEYYQIRLSYNGKAGAVHHVLRHFAQAFYRAEEDRLHDYAPRVKDVKFKLLSYME